MKAWGDDIYRGGGSGGTLNQAAFAKYERKSPNLRAWPFSRHSLNKGLAKLDFAKFRGLLYNGIFT